MSELISNFGIDWRLLLAQAVNFLILLWILKRFAYGPILKILQKRREEIEKGVRYTEEAKIRLEEIGEEKEATLNTARSEALSIIGQGEETAKKRKDEILKEANKKVETVVADAKRLIGEEKAKMGEEIFRSAEDLILRATSKIIGKMRPEEHNQELVREALKELKSTV